jgi:hypothetical protein
VLFIAEGARFHFDSTATRVLVGRLRELFAGATFLLLVGDEAFRPALTDQTSQDGAIDDEGSLCDETDVAALGLQPVRVWSLAL